MASGRDLCAARKESTESPGATVARILERRDNVLTVRDLDAIDGTPVLDIKPVLRQFLPVGEVRQPAWTDELMRDYWREENPAGTRS